MPEIRYEVIPHPSYRDTHVILTANGVGMRSYKRETVKPIFAAFGAYLAKESKNASA